MRAVVTLRGDLLTSSPLPQRGLADLHHADHVLHRAPELVHASGDQQSCRGEEQSIRGGGAGRRELPPPPPPPLPAPHRPEGRRPVCIQSLFILWTRRSAVMETSWVFTPNSSMWAKRGM